MKKSVWIGLMAGILLTIALFTYSGIGKIGDAIAAAGWLGVTLMALVHMLPVLLCAVAWRLVSPAESVAASGGGLGLFIRARWVRDAVGEMWITPPLGSELAGMRILTMAGMDQPQAAASTLVDLTEALASQVIYTVAGVLLVGFTLPGASFIVPTLAGLLLAAAAIGGFAYAQNAGLLLRIETVVSEWTSGWLEPVRISMQGIHAITRRIYRRRGAVLMAFLIHLLAWFVGAMAAWVGLRFIGHPLAWHQVVALEAMIAALRSVAFISPAGLGVQEAGYVLAGQLFGLDAATALALSMLQRAAEWLRAVPALLMWQACEGNHWWHSLRSRNM